VSYEAIPFHYRATKMDRNMLAIEKEGSGKGCTLFIAEVFLKLCGKQY
jgi:hypothetical protein